MLIETQHVPRKLASFHFAHVHRQRFFRPLHGSLVMGWELCCCPCPVDWRQHWQTVLGRTFRSGCKRPGQAVVVVVVVVVEAVGVAPTSEVLKGLIYAPFADVTDRRMGPACRAEGSLLGQLCDCGGAVAIAVCIGVSESEEIGPFVKNDRDNGSGDDR